MVGPFVSGKQWLLHSAGAGSLKILERVLPLSTLFQPKLSERVEDLSPLTTEPVAIVGTGLVVLISANYRLINKNAFQ